MVARGGLDWWWILLNRTIATTILLIKSAPDAKIEDVIFLRLLLLIKFCRFTATPDESIIRSTVIHFDAHLSELNLTESIARQDCTAYPT